MNGILAALVVLHVSLELLQDLTGFLCATMDVHRRRWLAPALTAGALLGVGGPIVLADLVPAHASAFLVMAGGAMLGDAILTHLVGSWVANTWAPASITVPIQIAVGSYLLLNEPAPLWLAIPPALSFAGLWLLFYILARRDEAARQLARDHVQYLRQHPLADEDRGAA